jgi:hypothetical protein
MIVPQVTFEGECQFRLGLSILEDHFFPLFRRRIRSQCGRGGVVVPIKDGGGFRLAEQAEIAI